MRKAIAKKIIYKHIRRYMRSQNKLMKECGIKIPFPDIEKDIESLEFTIFDYSYANPEDKDCICLSMDGEFHSYFSYAGELYQYYGMKLEEELSEKGFFAEPWDACHLDIREN